MSDMNRPASMALRRSLPGPRMCCCPANSDRSRGRILQARGDSDGSIAVNGRLGACFLRPTECFGKAGADTAQVIVRTIRTGESREHVYGERSVRRRSEEHTSELQSPT